MTTDHELVDFHIEELAGKIPCLLLEYPNSPKFLRALADLASVIVETAAVLGDEVRAHAEQRVGAMLLRYAPVRLRVVPPDGDPGLAPR